MASLNSSICLVAYADTQYRTLRARTRLAFGRKIWKSGSNNSAWHSRKNLSSTHLSARLRWNASCVASSQSHVMSCSSIRKIFISARYEPKSKNQRPQSSRMTFWQWWNDQTITWYAWGDWQWYLWYQIHSYLLVPHRSACKLSNLSSATRNRAGLRRQRYIKISSICNLFRLSHKLISQAASFYRKMVHARSTDTLRLEEQPSRPSKPTDDEVREMLFFIPGKNRESQRRTCERITIDDKICFDQDWWSKGNISESYVEFSDKFISMLSGSAPMRDSHVKWTNFANHQVKCPTAAATLIYFAPFQMCAKACEFEKSNRKNRETSYWYVMLKLVFAPKTI